MNSYEEASAAVEHISIHQAALKLNLENFYKCKHISLDDRWKIFKSAPSNLKNSDNWILHCKPLDDMFSGEVSWYDDFYVDRYAVMDMDELVERLEEDEDPENEYKSFKRATITKEGIDKVKEFILEKNLGSFTNDW